MIMQSTLPEMAVELGFPVKKQGRSWGGAACPVCGPGTESSNRLNIFVGRDGKWRFRCHACYAHGDAADFLAQARGIPLRDAIKEVRGVAGINVMEVDRTEEQSRRAALKIAIERICRAATSGRKEIGRYLADRGISASILDLAIDRGLVRCMPADPRDAQRFLDEVVGEKLLRQSGLLKDAARWSAIAFRPLIGVLPGGSAEFRLARSPVEGEVKAIRYGHLAWPWWLRGGEKPIRRAVVVEGVIDLLSVAQLGLGEDEGVMGIPGAASWKPAWFETLAAKHGSNIQIDVGLDADDAGNRASEAIIEAARSAGLPASRLEPPAKDWNEVLRSTP